MECSPSHFLFWLFVGLALINAVGVASYLYQVFIAARLSRVMRNMAPAFEPVGSIIPGEHGPEFHFPDGVPTAGTLLFTLKPEGHTREL